VLAARKSPGRRLWSHPRMARIERAYAAYDRWGEAWGLPPAARIYVNRNLKMAKVRAIGFDLDHTLAFYRSRAIEVLAFEETKKKLIAEHGFPEEILTLRYNPRFVIRGLVVDRRHGNLIKMDGHNYVHRAYHGTHVMPDEERRRTYAHRRLRIAQDAYVAVDTLFHLPEAFLYQCLVDLRDRGVKGIPEDYGEIYLRVRRSIDRAHADGSVKQKVAADPGAYLQVDPNLGPALHRFREAGKRLFLLTNSDLAYTDLVLAYTFGGEAVQFGDWRDAFDVVLVEAGKPRFFLPEVSGTPVERIEVRGSGTRILRGGDASSFERALGHLGDEILYFGDHTFGDILRSKKSQGWRTAMIVPELRRELRVTQKTAPQMNELAELNRRLDYLRVERGRLEKRSRRHREGEDADVPPGENTGPADERLRMAQEWADLVRSMEAVGDRCDRAYNPYWGALFREGREVSYFGQQVKEFACIYTARVSNFVHYPADHYFQAPGDLMPHEL
jgi:5'-nucleotidase